MGGRVCPFCGEAPADEACEKCGEEMCEACIGPHMWVCDEYEDDYEEAG